MKQIIKNIDLSYLTKDGLTKIKEGLIASGNYVQVIDATLTIDGNVLKIESNDFSIRYSWLDFVDYRLEFLTTEYMQKYYPNIVYDTKFVKDFSRKLNLMQRPMSDIFKPNKIYTDEIITSDAIFYKILDRKSVTTTNWKLIL
jgi:hypothetical protein